MNKLDFKLLLLIVIPVLLIAGVIGGMLWFGYRVYTDLAIWDLDLSGCLIMGFYPQSYES